VQPFQNHADISINSNLLIVHRNTASCNAIEIGIPMCGIAGIIASDSLKPVERMAIGGMLQHLRHRGPDGEGRYDDDHAILGHRRLAIRDLSGGRQPMSDASGRIRTIVNGEFYDHAEVRTRLESFGHHFRTECDSEILPHLYAAFGDACLDSLDGMFGLAVWDARRRRCLLARDRMGVKPLYYHVDERRLVFASELSAVLAAPGVPREIDPAALADYFTFGFIPSPRTIYTGVRKLPAGHSLVYADGRATVQAYWDLKHTGWGDLSRDATAEALWAQLRVATRKRMLADVPIGAFLSGGLDSTAVVSAMSHLTPARLTTFTSGFDEASFDERQHAARIAAIVGSEHHESPVRLDTEDAIDAFARCLDEPLADPSALPMYMMSAHARRHMTVVLSGDGGDEVLAGYRRYRFDVNEQRVRRMVPRVLRRAIFAPAAALYPDGRRLPRPLRAGRTLRNLADDPATAHARSISTTDPDQASDLISLELRLHLRDYDALESVRAAYRRCDAPDHLSRCQYADMRTVLADGILTKVDRSSMAHGLEVRSPMLDYRFIEFAWRIAPHHRIRLGQGKAPLRDAVRRHLCDGLAADDSRRIWSSVCAQRAKKGFDVPLDSWFRGHLRDRLEDAIRSDDLRSLINVSAIRSVIDEHVSGVRNAGPTLWKVLMLAGWLDRVHGSSSTLSVETSAMTCTP